MEGGIRGGAMDGRAFDAAGLAARPVPQARLHVRVDRARVRATQIPAPGYCGARRGRTRS